MEDPVRLFLHEYALYEVTGSLNMCMVNIPQTDYGVTAFYVLFCVCLISLFDKL